MAASPCPLGAALLEILQVCALLGVHDDQTLADYLHRTKGSIHTEWSRILSELEVHSRHQAIDHALMEGWVRMPTHEERDAAWRAFRARRGGGGEITDRPGENVVI